MLKEVEHLMDVAGISPKEEAGGADWYKLMWLPVAVDGVNQWRCCKVGPEHDWTVIKTIPGDQRPPVDDLKSTLWQVETCLKESKLKPDQREALELVARIIEGPQVTCTRCFGIKEYFVPAVAHLDSRHPNGIWRECVWCHGQGTISQLDSERKFDSDPTELEELRPYTDQITTCAVCEAPVAFVARFNGHRSVPVCCEEHAEVILGKLTS